MSNRIYEYYLPMRDGVKLYTYAVIPEHGEKFPVIICRNPYCVSEPPDKESLAAQDLHGYVCVFQHCRGTGLSEGDFIHYVNERNDGIDTIEWIRKQDFYAEELYLQGGSYLASVHFSYLNCGCKDIKGAYLAVQDSERYNIIYRNGFFKVGLHGGWAVSMYRKNSITEKNIKPEKWLVRPLAGSTPDMLGERYDQLEEELQHPDPADEFWRTPAGGGDYSKVMTKTDIPVFLATSHYDIYTEGVIDMWESMDEEHRKKCALLITPFSHAYAAVPEKPDYPECPGGALSEITKEPWILWFDHIRNGSDPGFLPAGKIKYYSMWENAWHTVDSLQNAPVRHEFYLASDRRLAPVGDDGKITYLYDPEDPAHFNGGCCHCFGAVELQDPPNSRQDIISFESAPLEKMDVSGNMELFFEVSTTAPDTCFYARVSVVKGDKTYPLRDEIDSVCRTVPDFRSGDRAGLNFRFTFHSFRIEAGDKLRLDISSSCALQFLVHPNRKGNIALQTGSDKAHNTIFTGKSKLTVFADR